MKTPRHGHAHVGKVTRTYSIWLLMRSRCNSIGNDQYSIYGGRGIKVCARWSKYENFLLDMGEAPKGLQIDRIDNDGNYEPGNCRWVTPKQNMNNPTNKFNHGIPSAAWAKRGCR